MNPTLMSQAGTQGLISHAYQQGQALQNQYNQQAGQLQGQYQTDVNQKNAAYNQANSAYGNLLNYTQNLPSTYMQDIGSVGRSLGYNPALTSTASQNSANLAEAYANAPKAVQQMGNYSGATAGQETQNLNNMSGQLSGASAQANQLYQNQLAAQQNVLGGVNTLVNNQTTGYSNALTGASNIYQGATSAMQSAGQTMASIENLQQKQGYVTAEQMNQYQSAYNGYVTAQAAAQKAAAYAQLTASQTRGQNISNQMQQNALNLTNRSQMKQRTGGGYNFMESKNQGGGAESAATYAQQNNIPFSQLLRQMAASGDQGAAQALSAMQRYGGIGSSGQTPQWISQQISPSLTWGANLQGLSGL